MVDINCFYRHIPLPKKHIKKVVHFVSAKQSQNSNMRLVSSPWCLEFPSLIHTYTKDPSLCFLSRRRSGSSLPSSTSLKRWNFCVQKKGYTVRCSKVEVKDELDIEACELVNGSELTIGEGTDKINALFFSAVKNNNGVGILLLSDVFGLEDSYNRDFAYRVACNGYNVLVPDLFRGDPWSRDRSEDLLEPWLAKQEPERVANDIATSTKWMVDEFKAAGSDKKLGLIGFCYGGARILEVLATDKKSTFGTGVSFYGYRMDEAAAQNVEVPVLLITGSNDPFVPVKEVNEIGDVLGSESRVVVFEGRGHGFVHRPQTPEEDVDADKAFMIMRNWLSDHLLNKN